MSYNSNNFPYFKSPSNANQFWDPRNSKSSMDADRNAKFGTNKQSRPSFTPNLILSNSNRSGEIQGVVTQLFSSFGYINDNIIFSKTDVVGAPVQKGDAVEVFASYQPNNPTKYKGERVCKIDQSRFNSNSTANFGKMKTLSQGVSGRIGPQVNTRLDSKYDSPSTNPRLGVSLKNRLAGKYESSNRALANLAEFRRSVALKDKKGNQGAKNAKVIVDVDKNTDKEKDTPRPNDVKNDKKKKVEPPRKTQEAPKRKADSPINFYSDPKPTFATKPVVVTPPITAVTVKTVPKYYENFALRELDCAAVKNQCQTLNLPKEFFHASLKYQQSFPLNHPMKLGNNCQFKIMDKRVKSIDNYTEAQLNKDIDPDDADTTFVAKVMLLSTDDLAKFYKDTLTLAEEFDGDNKIPITKAIKFLVGSVGQDKEFGIGGAWSPSLDGVDPETNGRVLINTAIRTCKALTGIDLSHCSSWAKFLELHYYRPLQEIKKNGQIDASSGNVVIDVDANEEPKEFREPRMETVVYYIPDVWNSVPSQDSWSEITRLYLDQLTCIMCPPPPAAPVKPVASNVVVPPTITTDEKSLTEGDQVEEEDWNENEGTEDVPKISEPEPPVDQPTHYSKLVVAGMKIVDIKKELELRKLNNRGVMEQLKARLKAALDREETEERNKDNASVVATVVVEPAAPKCLLSDAEKNELKKLYLLPEQPSIIVHQNKTLFGKQTKIQVMTLQSMLNYRTTTLPEPTFELALFAKQFLSMLRRDAVFNVYKSIVVAPECDLCNIDNPEKRAKLMVTTSKRTVNRPLLFSCCLLDSNKANKISLDDLKILIEGLGICLSSDQLSVLLTKVKDSCNNFNYRQLTDKEMTDGDIDKMLNLDVSEDLDYIKELSMGNKALFDAEMVQMDTLMNDDDDTERLKNELDKSERCRQTIELKVAEIKEETERNAKLVRTQAKDIANWKVQAIDYKAKYETERSRCERLQRDFDRLLGRFKNVDQVSVALGRLVTETLDRYSGMVENKTGDSVREAGNRVDMDDDVSGNIVMDLTEDTEQGDGANAGGVVATMVEEHKDGEGDQSINSGIQQSSGQEDQGAIVIDQSATATIDDQVAATESDNLVTEQRPAVAIAAAVATLPRQKQPGTTATTTAEDFDLSKPSDYDMIMLDETD